ncbi:MAG: aldo/keto reductase [Defluviitaleaceae bacterium]|nr:aldo/keto reductase [Defluviitaleaceae bacterium]
MELTKVKHWGCISVSRLGYGAMRFPTIDGKIDREPSEAMVDAAFKGGVNYFDTAYIYLNQESESFMGEVLSKYPRDSFYIATKLPIWLANQEKDVIKIFEEQLNRLRVEMIDFYMLHALNGGRWNAAKKLRAMEQLLEEKKKGRIKFLGFSYHGDLETFKGLVDEFDWDFVQIQINYADYEMIGAKAYFDILAEKKIPCIVMEPVRGGFLADPPPRVSELMTALDSKLSPAAWAMRWCMDLDNTPVILSGMSHMDQVEDNLETFKVPKKLSSGEKEMFASAVDVLKSVKSVPCTACNYCMDCPYGVDIPGIFSIYNIQQLFGNNFRANADYKDFLELKKAGDKCINCGQCAPLCPQDIDIPNKLTELHEFLLKVYP